MTSSKLFNLIGYIEKISAYAQGKGYGESTIKKEISLAIKLLGYHPKIAIDIGGNVGNYTAELRRLFPTLEIHTFEPSETNITKLKARFANDKNIHLIPCAVSNSTGQASLFSNEPGSGLGSLTKRKLDHFGISFDVKESVKTIRLDEYWETELKQVPLDFVKIDIEGHELSALSGFGKAIHQTKVIQFEFGGCNIDTRTYFQDFWYFFRENNFSIFRITPIGLQKICDYREADEFFSTTNYLAFRT
jgi:FkbM family methyltransferase